MVRLSHYAEGNPRLCSSAGGFSIEERVAAVQERITRARLDGPIPASDVTIRAVSSEPASFTRDVMIITADLLHACANKSSQFELVKACLANLGDEEFDHE